MVDLQTVCCMCGDVGFSEKLFRCSKCYNRFQHSYCSSYYRENGESIEVCDWCQREERNSSSKQVGNSSSSPRNSAKSGSEVRSAYSGDKIRLNEGGATTEKAAGKTSSPRPTARRYKLLKDVMC